MRLYSQFSFDTLSNSYLVGPDNGGDAVLFDPATFDVALLEIVERHGYYVRSVVLTHIDEAHMEGLRTIRRIYDCTVYAAHPTVLGEQAVTVSDRQELDIGAEPIRVISLPGHGSDSVAYYTGGFLFAGSAMSAAEHGLVVNQYSKALLLADIRDRVFTLPDETVILPFRGPPTTVRIEKETLPMDVSVRPSWPS